MNKDNKTKNKKLENKKINNKETAKVNGGSRWIPLSLDQAIKNGPREVKDIISKA